MSLPWPHIVSAASCSPPTRSARQNDDARFATVMKKQRVSVPEAMLAITQARLKQQKPRVLPSKRIVAMLNNDIWLKQLEMWQACKYNLYNYTIVNPKDLPERWIVEKVSERPQGKSRNVSSVLKRPDRRVRQLSEQPHRLSTIEEEEEEARRLSMIEETSSSPKDLEVAEEARRPSMIEGVSSSPKHPEVYEEARPLRSPSRATVRGVEFDMQS